MFATPCGNKQEFFCIHCNPLKIYNGTDLFIDHLKTTHPEVYFTVKMVLDVTSPSSSSKHWTSPGVKRDCGIFEERTDEKRNTSLEYESSLDELCEAELIEDDEDSSLMVMPPSLLDDNDEEDKEDEDCNDHNDEADKDCNQEIEPDSPRLLTTTLVDSLPAVAKPTSSTDHDIDQDQPEPDVLISETVKSALLYPIRVDGKYRCPYKQCPSRGFKMWLDYRDHINNHNGIKPHRCNYCGRSFSYQTTLRRHQRAHLSQEKHLTPGQQMAITRPWVCHHCQVRFVSNDTLRRHLMQKHSNSVHCPWCELHFANQDQMNYHVKKSHHQQQSSHLPKTESPMPSTSTSTWNVKCEQQNDELSFGNFSQTYPNY